ncbi:HesB/YadR/YfhF family protein [Paenibacillus sp. GCM10023252]|uniref:HesB/YadR/YfhF family protein n=1 Tax=Paenibacillus sp. GCM10023252 TaxID=3252649 RepID=UPI0036207CD5
MKLSITAAAAERFRLEWGFQDNDQIRVFVRYSGGSSDAYSFGIMKDVPRYAAVTSQEQGIMFFMEQNDIWFLDGHDLVIDSEQDEIVFRLHS